MQVETALFFETVEEIYARVFRTIKPRTDVPAITVRFCKYANANSKIRLNDGELTVQISDLLQPAPAPVQEALACILLGKLFRKPPDTGVLALYQRYMGRTEVRRSLQLAKQQRGRKTLAPPAGKHYDLVEIFTELNRKYFRDSLSRPMLGWSRRPARTILGSLRSVASCDRVDQVAGFRPGSAALGRLCDVPRDAPYRISDGTWSSAPAHSH